MPELPEVETIRRGLRPEIVGRSVIEASSHGSAKFTPALDVAGAAFTGIGRRGKYLLIGLDDDRELVVHLGMTGALHRLTPDQSHAPEPAVTLDDPYIRARWNLDDHSVLVFRDVRRFGRLRVVPSGDYRTIKTLAEIGPEPLESDFTPATLHAAIKKSSRRVKTQLLSQRPVAGVGNIYADEALWRAQIYPAQRTLSRPEAERLHPAIVDVLQAGVDNGGTTLRDYRTASGDEGTNQHHLDCYGQAGEPCPRCSTELVSRVWDARTTTFCPACQRRR